MRPTNGAIIRNESRMTLSKGSTPTQVSTPCKESLHGLVPVNLYDPTCLDSHPANARCNL